MSDTGKPVTDFSRPLCLMRSGSKTFWSYYVHIVSGSTIVFKDGPGKAKNLACSLSTTCERPRLEAHRTP
eukprot:2661705-Pyramimonas_sp.AAC.1